MGVFDFLTGRKQQTNESVRVTKNTDNTDNMYYDPDSYSLIGGDTEVLTMAEINKFRLLKSNRSEKYRSYDLMAQDSRIASVLNMYTDDCTQYNQSGNVIWAESQDPDIAEFANRIINNLQLNKNAWNHIYSLCKYGDLYLELFYDDETDEKYSDQLGDGPIYKRKEGARLIERIEAIKNPANIFDLIHQGKTAFFVKCNDREDVYETGIQNLAYNNYAYDEKDIILPPDKFLHIYINDAFTRFPSKYILKNTKTDTETTYDIKEGTSVLANVFKTWSELNLLEDSVLLNRLSKSAIIRLIQVEVGNTDDNEVRNLLIQLRDKISRSRYFDKSNGEYKNQVNPGPLENIIYHATHKGNGAITHSTIGGDVDVKALADVDHFLEKLAMGFPIPLAYLKQSNDDGGGLSAGTSLTKFDARYGRTLKRYQNAYINGITDLINVFALKRGMESYINEFTIKMVSPSAVEDNERDEKLEHHTSMIRDIMDVLTGIEEGYDIVTLKQILNYLIQTMLQDEGLTDLLTTDAESDKREVQYDDLNEELEQDNPDGFSDHRMGPSSGSNNNDFDMNDDLNIPDEIELPPVDNNNGEPSSEPSDEANV